MLAQIGGHARFLLYEMVKRGGKYLQTCRVSRLILIVLLLKQSPLRALPVKQVRTYIFKVSMTIIGQIYLKRKHKRGSTQSAVLLTSTSIRHLHLGEE